MVPSSEVNNRVARTLEASEARFRLLLEALPHIAFVIAAGGMGEIYNRAFTEYAGPRLRPDRESRLALIHPDDRRPYAEARDAGVAAVSDYIVEVRLLRHDDAYRWHRIHNKPLENRGGRVDWLGTAVDVHDVRHANDLLEQRVAQRTSELELAVRHLEAEAERRRAVEEEQRLSEARFRHMYNQTPVALQSTDAEARLMDVNDTWVAMFGRHRHQALGRCPAEFMTPGSARLYRERAWPEMLASAGALRVMDYQFIRPGGAVFDGRIAARGEFDDHGRFVRTWSAIADVTAEKRADQEARQSQRMEAVGHLTAGIAHDFNNLLTAVLSSLELLARPGPPDAAKTSRLIAGARAAAERGARLTAQLLAFSRQHPVTIQPIDVNAAIQAMKPLLQTTTGATIVIDFALEPGIGPALADLTQFEMAVLNLAINARDAMQQGGAITLATASVTRGPPQRTEEPPAGDYVAVTVADTGSGIPDAVRDRIFEPFFTTKELGRGSGLGLAQLLGIAKQIGGGVSVRSVPNEGTAIALYLPLAGGKTEVQRPDVAQPDAQGRAGVQATILLVDDDPAVRATTAELLRDAGHVVVESASAAAALDHLERVGGHAALMLVDVAMPRMNGVELATIVRRGWPGLPIVFMTGYAEQTLLPNDAWRAVLRKPFTGRELDARVKEALHAARA